MAQAVTLKQDAQGGCWKLGKKGWEMVGWMLPLVVKQWEARGCKVKVVTGGGAR